MAYIPTALEDPILAVLQWPLAMFPPFMQSCHVDWDTNINALIAVCVILNRLVKIDFTALSPHDQDVSSHTCQPVVYKLIACFHCDHIRLPSKDSMRMVDVQQLQLCMSGQRIFHLNNDNCQVI